MPVIDELLDVVAGIITRRKPGGNNLFSTIDLKYAYSQIPLDEKTRIHCNFNIIGCEATGTYRFLTSFYGLTSMPAEIQRVMDNPVSYTHLKLGMHGAKNYDAILNF